MDREQIVINSRLLQNLNTYIDEDDVTNSIVRLNSEVEKIESTSGQSKHTVEIRREISILEDQLTYSKVQANLRTQQYRNSNL